ncbi:MAG: hypothetical protein Q8O54_09895, partial [Brevundimonas sp.]|nr:hypothetical protein [Brevundimonas sp.]
QSDSYNWMRQAVIFANNPSQSEKEKAIAAVKNAAFGARGYERFPNRVIVDLSVSCLNDKDESPRLPIKAADAYQNTFFLISRSARQENLNNQWKLSQEADIYLTSYFIRQLQKNDCSLKQVVVQQSFELSSISKDVGLLNMYLATFGLTQYHISNSVSMKFSPFLTVDPYVQFRQFIIDSVAISGIPPFGVGGHDEQIESLAFQLRQAPYHPPGRINVPFSTLATSSLGATIVFGVFLFVGFIARFRQIAGSLVLRRNWRVMTRALPVTSIMFSILIMITMLVIIYGAMELISGLFWRSLIPS